MRLLLDTNIILDDALNRAGLAAASKTVIALCGSQHEPWVAWHSLSNIYYVARRHPVQRPNALQIIRDVLTWADVAGASRSLAIRATRLGFSDFEDALQSAAAEACGADFIITHNVKDFTGSHIPALTPEDFLAQYHPDHPDHSP